MKKLLYISLVVAASTNAVAQSGWSLGVFTSGSGNHSTYSDGMSDANALFNHNEYGSGTIGALGRYFINDHWSIQSGANFSQIGFEYSLSKDYSLLSKKDDHYTKSDVGVSVVQIPVTAIYAFKPNCQNFRFFVGGGISIMNNLNKVDKTQNTQPKAEEGAANAIYLDQTVTASTFTVATGQFMWGIEKLLKRGNIIQWGVVCNKGFTNIATSAVTYSAEGKQYSHTFKNQGDYCGFMLNFYLKPFKKK